MSLLKARIKLQQAQESLNRGLITLEQFEQIKAECEQWAVEPRSVAPQATSEPVEPVAPKPGPSRPRRNRPAATPDRPAANPEPGAGGPDDADPDNSGND
ncbi:hypothetical protein ACS5NO_17590 [Larkinella sp. GY13]|uniref:hypothetical protein n=1 Tax=Larkinella sp. GY13 TaxID=3453720 RepID=UPI003EEC094F